MAAQSIVDFVKCSLATSPDAGFVLRPAAAPSINERQYVTDAWKVIVVLNHTPGLTARQIFDAAGAEQFVVFNKSLAEMARRGLLSAAGHDPRYDDEILILSAASKG